MGKWDGTGLVAADDDRYPAGGRVWYAGPVLGPVREWESTLTGDPLPEPEPGEPGIVAEVLRVSVPGAVDDGVVRIRVAWDMSGELGWFPEQSVAFTRPPGPALPPRPIVTEPIDGRTVTHEVLRSVAERLGVPWQRGAWRAAGPHVLNTSDACVAQAHGVDLFQDADKCHISAPRGHQVWSWLAR